MCYKGRNYYRKHRERKRGNNMSDLIAKEYKCFEDIKHINEDRTEYWSARELALVLDYTKWENFHKVIKRAMIARTAVMI